MLNQQASSKWISLVFLIAAAVVMASGYVETGQGSPVQSPEAAVEKGRVAFGQVCVNCHGLSKTAILRKDSERWRGTVYSMISRGAQLMPDEIEPLITYLSVTYGPDSPPPIFGDDGIQPQVLPEGPGRAILVRSCFQCHAVQLVVESRKTEREWKETVTRMVGHGASLTAQEQEVLIKYAAEYFGAE